jgi:hypothetical protein
MSALRLPDVVPAEDRVPEGAHRALIGPFAQDHPQRATMRPMEKQNRADRRKNKFGGGRASEHGGWPTSQPNPVFGADMPTGDVPTGDVPSGDVPADEAVAGAPGEDQTAATGAGTGGATEQAGRAPRHEGTHASDSTKG